MSSRRGTSGLIVLSLAAVAFMAAAGAADAKKHHRKKHRLGPVIVQSASGSASGLGAIATETATCPGKTRAVGGGFAGTPPNDAVFPLIYESQKVAPNAWRASSQIVDVSAPSAMTSLTAFALCRRNAPKTSTSSTTVPTATTFQSGPSAAISCVPGRKLQAGGFVTEPPLIGSQIRSIVASSAPSGPATWQSTVISDHGGSLTSVAYCAKAKKPLPQVTGAAVSDTTSQSTTHALATCPGLRKTPQVGGFAQTPSLGGMGGGYLIPYESDPAGKDWNVLGLHIGMAPIPLTATALCG
jgi:hypothetical protein